MSSESACERFREIAPELALGIADGEQRAAGLSHVGECADCRRLLDELAGSADELLTLAPEHEPPLGFESRVVRAMRAAEATRLPARRRRRLPYLAAAATAAVLAAGIVALAYRDDHRIASMYRHTLSEANGSYFTAATLTAGGGPAVGHVFGYQGDPSWLLVSVEAPAGVLPDGRYVCRLLGPDGGQVRFGSVTVEGGRGSYGRAIGADLDAVGEVQLVGPDGGPLIQADLEEP